MRSALIGGLLPLIVSVSAGFVNLDMLSVSTSTTTVTPISMAATKVTTVSVSKSTSKSKSKSSTSASWKAKETVSIDVPASHRHPLDPFTVPGEDTVSTTKDKQNNFTLIAFPQLSNNAPDSMGLIAAIENHSDNKTVGLRRFGKDVFATDLLDVKAASQKPVRYNLVQGRLETDDKASEVHYVLYFNLLQWKNQPDTDEIYFPIWSTNKDKKSIHDNKLVKKLQMKLVMDKGNGFYRLESETAGDWSYCTATPSIFQKGTLLLVGGQHELHDGFHQTFESLVYGNRERLPQEWKCASYGVQAIWI